MLVLTNTPKPKLLGPLALVPVARRCLLLFLVFFPLLSSPLQSCVKVQRTAARRRVLDDTVAVDSTLQRAQNLSAQ